MNTHSIEIPEKLIKNCAFFLYSTTTYVALGFWVSIAPQSIAQSELADRVDSTSTVSHSSALKDDIPIGADDLERPPKFLDLPGNADHFDLLYAEKHSDAMTPFFPSRATTDGKKLTLDMFEKAEVCAGCHGTIYDEWKD